MLSRGGEVGRLAALFFCACSITWIALGAPDSVLGLQYQSPLPGARYVRKETGIILRAPGPVDRSNVPSPDIISVTGSASGRHEGSVKLSDDGRTLVFSPRAAFSPGETVTVQFAYGIRLADGEVALPKDFSFFISPSTPLVPPTNQRSPGEIFGIPRQGAAPETTTVLPKIDRPDTLPVDFPYIQTTLSGTPAEGRLFLANVRFSGPFVPYMLILDDTGTPIFYRKMNAWCSDFKVQPNGLLTYYDTFSERYYALDSSYAVVDSFYCGNGYTTDLHELRLLPDGHALLLGQDPEAVDMSTIVQGGNPRAVVTGIVLQELDRDKNVVFEWRSWDHFQITDATHEDLRASKIDYVHSNAIELDGDGNILLSSRHLDEITKIDRATGETLWRMGGKHNEFTFVNDPIGFSHQHAVRRLDNGDFILFDNGNFHSPQFSRAVEYQVDESAMTATLVWQYRHTPDVYGSAMGYVQRFTGGHTLIGWGATNPTVTELDENGSKILELTFEPGAYSYRAYRYVWKPDSTDSTSTGPALPTAFALSQNYPNPFNGITQIVVTVSQPESMTMKVCDILEREVATILDGVRQAPGEYRVTLNLESLASGIYFCRLLAGSASITRKLTLVR